MKILYLITRSDVLGGASIHLLDLAEGIQALGHEVLVLVGGDGVFLEYAAKRGIPARSIKHLVREISPWQDFFSVREFMKAIENYAPDLVHLHSSKAGVIGRVAAHFKGVPVVFTAHGWAFTDGVSSGRKRIYSFVEKVLARFTTKIITVSDYDRAIALRRRVADANLMVTIHNGVPDAPFTSAKNHEGGTRFIMIARFEEPKDHSLLLHAFAAISDRSWSVEFVGDGPLQQQCKELATRLDISDRVVFSGFREDIDRRIAVSDVLVLASKWEGLPLTVIEAMRGGLPVVASKVGGVPELVIDGVTGYLAENGETSAMANCLDRVIGDPEKLSAMGLAARDRYERYFSFEMMRNRTLAVYRAACNENGI